MKGDSTGGKRQVADLLRQTNSARERGPSLDTLDSLVVPLWPTRGFWSFCMDEIRRGLLLRYWITLPSRWRRELQFRRDLTDCLNGHNDMLTVSGVDTKGQS